MNIKDLKAQYEGQYADCEVYRFRDSEHVVNAEYITAINDADENETVCQYRLMDEKEYNRTIYANSSYTANFEDYFDDKDAKVLIIILSEKKR